MQRSLLICAVIMLAVSCTVPLQADDLQLTLDMRNASRPNAFAGGTWELYARVIDTGVGVDGSTGIAGLRALLDNIDPAGITFNPGINPNGAATVQVLSGDPQGTVEIVYRQDLSQTTLASVGVPPVFAPNRDVLIASGSWPAGLRPVFGNDGSDLSSGDVLGGDGNSAVAADNVFTSVVTLGDLNRSGSISGADIGLFVEQLPGMPFPPSYNPAADINQTGTVSNSDIGGFVGILAGPLTAASTGVPEPDTIGLLLISGLGLLLRRKVRTD
ncbi:PEP-CTERM sorting domain-containing protein [Bythopirellula polymerisocia]|uniref:PEP-CTERM protein-sorting domain-containing protein n=1 Tax=Bythopirellula polymerisocia TaxID=2528003 RepID=A0A5C6D0G2_9BACT|nr:PEP-CTERM sorting domain-containing protein [Bythopirellula polymerisocia]TWU30208.1 hypothetical protein Pla144_09940 [Bythopirellula polymerisocia]